MKTSISVVIPVYNNEKAIRKTLSALINQDYPREKFEIIVVDNGSTDGSIEVVKQFKDVILLLEHKNLSSPYSARNRGIEKARGDIIVLLDSTCTPVKEWLTEGTKCLKEQEANIVGGDVVFNYGNKVTAGKLYDSLTNVRMEKSISERNVAKTGNLFIQREVFNAIGLFPEGIRSGGDVRWTRRATNAGFKMVFCKKASANYPARDTLELFKKQWRVGLWQPDIWKEEGKELKLVNIIIKTLIPAKPWKVSSMIKRNGKPFMKKYLYQMMIIRQTIKLIMGVANCVKIIRIRHFNKK